MIYSYCFVPPYETTDESIVPVAPSLGEDQDDLVILHEQAKIHVQKCQHNNAHLGVIHINRQIRHEAYQYFAATHTLNFSNTLDFANGYLRHVPAHCLGQIKSLNLTWQVREKCSASLPVRRSGRKSIDIKSDIYKVLQVFETYPELLMCVDRLGFTLPFFCAYQHGHCGELQKEMRADLMRLSITLCEKIDEFVQSSWPNSDHQYFLVEIAWSNTWYTRLWRVSKQIFDQIGDQDVIQKGDCETCAAATGVESFRGSSHREHDGAFANIEEILQAIKNGKRRNPPENRKYNQSNVDKKWKAIFHPFGPLRSFNMIISYLEANRKSSLSTMRSNKRKRPTARSIFAP